MEIRNAQMARWFHFISWCNPQTIIFSQLVSGFELWARLFYKQQNFIRRRRYRNKKHFNSMAPKYVPDSTQQFGYYFKNKTVTWSHLDDLNLDPQVLEQVERTIARYS